MRSYNQNNRSGGRRHGGGNFRRRDSGRREMHKTVCDECGNNCEVPFRPSGDKPIYCSDCFEKKESGSLRKSDRKSSRRLGGEERDRTNKQLLDQVTLINTKLDSIMSVIVSGVGEKKAAKEVKAKQVTKKAILKNEQVEEKKQKKKVAKKSTTKD